ncbi:hypothetical protein IFM89_038820 [Coptis chinensis]|uniref:PWWP domain-containing protein n=1 Tax=Coptis chinensis TaxID=261450 RepID=A0A835LQP5_9MAGN|nr:hypothetical protein IFM89_038820 [Coptis chinensis]
MRSNHLENSKKHFSKVAVKDSHVVKSSEGSTSGDLVWIRLRGSLWWPAQVVDENMVSRSSRPRKRVPGGVLVRVYGTYTYLYRDLLKYRTEFKKILKQNDGSYLETFKKALEQDLSHRKRTTSKRTICESGEAVAATPTDEKLKHDTNKNNEQKFGSSGTVTPPLKVSSKLNVRRIRVMQSLGLVAPLGSTFHNSNSVLYDI